MNRHSLRAGFFSALIALVTAGGVVSAQTNGQRITPNFKDAEIGQVIEAVAAATGKTIIPDPRVRAQVTMLSQTAMSPEAFYEAFLALLQVHQFVAVESGGIIRIVPDANARQLVNQDLPSRVRPASEELVTQVIAVKNVNAAQLVPVLRPLQPQSAHLAAYPSGNILIISDRASNVSRIQRIIERIDQVGDNEVDIIRLEHASSSEVVRVVNTFFQQAAAAEGGGAGAAPRVIADDRSNSVLIGGEKSSRLRIKTLIAHLDTPLDNGGDTQVVYLQFADAEKIATKLKEQISATVAITGAAPQGGAPGGGVAASADRTTTIWAEPETNALVITAPQKVMRSLMAVVDKLDIRRAQVLVEAIIVDVSVNKNAELGVNWAVWSEENDTRIPVGSFINPVAGVNLVDLAAAVDNPSGAAQAGIPAGTTFGLGRIASSGVNFAAMIRALQSDSNTNVIATPSAVTMDNQEAELKVAQEVPFVTGSYAQTGGQNNQINPFTTVQRQEVGTILKITPQVNEGGALVQLKIELESSELANQTGDANSLITNKRTVNTNVLIEDGGIVVLGGLIRDSARRGENRVPYLGRIPVIGQLFKTRNRAREKANLMVFIRPKILRDGVDTAIATDAKYNFIRQRQMEAGSQPGEILPLIPFNKDPQLPPIPPPAAAPSVLPSEETIPPEQKPAEEPGTPQP